MSKPLTSPFPYYGGKRRFAPYIWERLGSPTVYVEPFAGSLAVLLARPDGPGDREIVCDTDALIANFFRAVRNDPEMTAYYADNPTIHQDLQARQKWLVEWRDGGGAAQVCEDADFYDCKVAGWWVWGISNWIGSGWCPPTGPQYDQIPAVPNERGGQGVQAQRKKLKDEIPIVQPHPGGQGISKQRIWEARPFSGRQGINVKKQALHEKRPRVCDHRGGFGVSAQRKWIGDADANILNWFVELQERLRSVVVLNRSWESAVTPTMLMHTPSSPKPAVGIFMDPPYKTLQRKDKLYDSDFDGQSDDTAISALVWAIKHGEDYRIAYACHEGDFDLPEGWDYKLMSFGGQRAHRTTQDCVMFSPACMDERQSKLDLEAI